MGLPCPARALFLQADISAPEGLKLMSRKEADEDAWIMGGVGGKGKKGAKGKVAKKGERGGRAAGRTAGRAVLLARAGRRCCCLLLRDGWGARGRRGAGPSQAPQTADGWLVQRSRARRRTRS